MKFILLFFSILILLSGCSSEIPDCTDFDKETDSYYMEYSYDSEKETCTAEKTEKKCGNSRFEDGEDFCNCPDDVVVDL